jgi:hypothetical protein
VYLDNVPDAEGSVPAGGHQHIIGVGDLIERRRISKVGKVYIIPWNNFLSV